MDRSAPRRSDDRPPPIALLDANVIYSQVLSDYFVHAEYQQLVVVKWSPAILSEMIRSKKARAERKFPDPQDLQPRLAAGLVGFADFQVAFGGEHDRDGAVPVGSGVGDRPVGDGSDGASRAYILDN